MMIEKIEIKKWDGLLMKDGRIVEAFDVSKPSVVFGYDVDAVGLPELIRVNVSDVVKVIKE
jgi:hypothetical protein